MKCGPVIMYQIAPKNKFLNETILARMANLKIFLPSLILIVMTTPLEYKIEALSLMSTSVSYNELTTYKILSSKIL